MNDLAHSRKLVFCTFRDSESGKETLYPCHQLNDILDDTKVHSEMGRLARPLDNIASLKAVEYRNIILFYFVAVD